MDRQAHRWAAVLAGCSVALLLGVGTTPGAVAARGTSYAAWTALTGSSGDFTGSVQVSPRFPAATYTSDSRSGQVGVQTGASTWLPAWTPVGQVYGSSQGEQYLNLRPRADRADEPSTTTYAFERATPRGWTFVLGDVDADAVQVSATTAAGTPATAAQLGFRSTFNYCRQTPRPGGCGGAQSDVPTWSAATRTLTGNAAARDTTGASGWFEPTVPLRTLTFRYTRRAGFPVYQTWFAVRTQDLTGTVALTGGTCSRAGIDVEVRDATGAVVGTTTTDASGDYALPRLPADSGYAVSIGGVPDTCRIVGPSRRTGVDLSTADAVADFAVRQLVPAAITGTVTEQGSTDPVAGATVTLTPAQGAPTTTTTAEDGSYAFDDNDPGSYTVTVTPPEGYAASVPPAVPVTVPQGDDRPLTGKDFALVANPDVTGSVTAGGEPVAGAVVELTSGGTTRRTFTEADGGYRFERVPSGRYAVTVPSPPSGYRVPAARTAQVAAADSTGNDFALTRPGSLGGAVTGVGPVAGATVTVTGPDGFRRVLRTDGQGRYLLDDLAPGSYTVRLTPPDGTRSSRTVRRVEITAAGEVFGDEDFTVTRVASPSPSPTPTPGDAPGSTTSRAAPSSTTGTAASTALPDTGGPSSGWLWAGGVPLLAGLALVVTGLRPRRSGRRVRAGGG